MLNRYWPAARICWISSRFLLVAVATLIGAPSAYAQFVCGKAGPTATSGTYVSDAANGQIITGGDGANASGDGSANVATGNNAAASGDGSENVASGEDANASGKNSGNVATGAGANASGDNSINTANGGLANASGSNSRNFASAAF